MTRNHTRNGGALRGTTPFAAILMVIALAALAQTRAPGQLSGRNPLDMNSSNLGPRLFLPAATYDSGGYTASSIAVGDINGDGKLDLVLGNRCASSGCGNGRGSVGVLLGNGDGTFQAAVAYDSGGSANFGYAQAVAIADLNGDHKPDIVVTNPGSNTVGVLLGNGDGTFRAAMIYNSGGMFPGSVAVADVNGDGRPDVLVTNGCSDSNCDGSVGVFLGNGDGTFQPAATYRSDGNVAQSVAVADVNHDGKPDLLVANDCASNCSKIGGEVSVLLGNGDGTFQPALSYASGGMHANSVAAADVNGDGNIDLALSNLGSNTVGVLLGNGDGTFQPAMVYSSNPGSPASAVVSAGIADIDGDGKLDLLVVNQSIGGDGNNGGAVAVLLGNGDGTFQPAVNYLSGGAQALQVAAGDVNGDGRTDVLVAVECSSNSYNCGGPINKTRGVVGVLLNNIGAPPTTTSLVSNVNPADINWVITYTAAVTSQSGGGLNGTVLFQDGAASIATVTLAGNQAAFSTTYAAKGTHSITATYSGVLNTAAGSTSAPLIETILTAHPTTTQIVTSGSPTFVGQPVTFTATVMSTYGSIPDGELMTFYDGPTAIGTNTTASGVARFSTSSLTAKTHAIKATYAGDVNFKSSSRTVTQVVNRYPTTTSLTSNPNPSHFGQAVTFTATVTSTGPYTPTGSVKFMDGTTWIGTVTLSGGVARITKSKLAVGTHPITAQYGGDAASAKSASTVLDQVVQ